MLRPQHDIRLSMRNFSGVRLSALLFAFSALASCDVPPPTVPHKSPAPPLEQHVPAMPNVKQHQMEFLNRIRQSDPQGRTIDRALLNEQNELGLILDRSVEMDKIPALTRSMLTQMAREFPNEDLTVIAYTPSNPPRKIGTAHLNAKTREMTYTAEK